MSGKSQYYVSLSFLILKRVANNLILPPFVYLLLLLLINEYYPSLSLYDPFVQKLLPLLIAGIVCLFLFFRDYNWLMSIKSLSRILDDTLQVPSWLRQLPSWFGYNSGVETIALPTVLFTFCFQFMAMRGIHSNFINFPFIDNSETGEIFFFCFFLFLINLFEYYRISKLELLTNLKEKYLSEHPQEIIEEEQPQVTEKRNKRFQMRKNTRNSQNRRK